MITEACQLRDEAMRFLESVLEAYSSSEQLVDVGGIVGLLEQALERAYYASMIDHSTDEHGENTNEEQSGKVNEENQTGKSKAQQKADEALRKASEAARRAEAAAAEESRKVAEATRKRAEAVAAEEFQKAADATRKAEAAAAEEQHRAMIAAARKKAEESIAARKAEENKVANEAKRKEEVQKALEAHQALMKKKELEAAKAAEVARKKEEAAAVAAAKLAAEAAAKREESEAKAARKAVRRASLAEEATALMAARKLEEEAKAARKAEAKEQAKESSKLRMAKAAAGRLRSSRKEVAKQEEQLQRKEQRGAVPEQKELQRETMRQQKESPVRLAGSDAAGESSTAERTAIQSPNESQGRKESQDPLEDKIVVMHDSLSSERQRGASTAANISSNRIRRAKGRKASIIDRLRGHGEGGKKKADSDSFDLFFEDLPESSPATKDEELDKMAAKFEKRSLATRSEKKSEDDDLWRDKKGADNPGKQADADQETNQIGSDPVDASFTQSLDADGTGSKEEDRQQWQQRRDLDRIDHEALEQRRLESESFDHLEQINEVLIDEGIGSITAEDWEEYQEWIREQDLNSQDLDEHEFLVGLPLFYFGQARFG